MSDQDIMRALNDYVDGTVAFEDVPAPDETTSDRVRDCYEELRWGDAHRKHMEDLFRRAHAGEDLVTEIKAGIEEMRDRTSMLYAMRDLRAGKVGSA